MSGARPASERGTAAAGRPAARAVALMHPDGDVRAERAVGARAAGRRPAAPETTGADADLVWLAPSVRECRRPGWLAGAADRLNRELARDGIAYVMPPPGWRGRLRAAFRAAGFETGPSVCHVGGRGGDRFVFSLGRHEARFLVATGLNLDPRLRRVVRWVAGSPGWPALAAELWPAVGFVARRAGSRPAWHWLTSATGTGGVPAGFVVVNGWRGPADSTLVHLLVGDRRAHVAVAKVGRAGAPTIEADVLAALGGAARAAGAALPHVLGTARLGGRRVVLLSAVPGARASDHLRARPNAVGPTLELVAGWLGRWHAGTRADAPLGVAEVDAHLLRPLRQVGPLLPDGDAYATRVRALAERLGDRPVPRVATHGDLTMYNVLLGGPERDALGVVDWEAGRADGWPLTDFEYAAVDIAAAAGGYRDRAGAWRACFAAAGGSADLPAAGRARLAAALQLPEPFAELCRHACWIQHAANEQRSGPPAGARPFLDVLRLVAAPPPARA